jgi:hypothetical protein
MNHFEVSEFSIASHRRNIRESLDRLIELYTVTNKPDEVKKYHALHAKHPTKKVVENRMLFASESREWGRWITK